MRIFLLYPYFFSSDGTKKKIGGVESYIESLAEVISNMGIAPVICQFAKEPFVREYLGFSIYGYNVKSIKQLYKKIEPSVNKQEDLIIFVSDLWATKLKDVKTLSVQHGIYWDIPRNKGPYILYYLQRVKQVLTALRDFNKTRYSVCVDYNFYNWYKTFNVKAKSKKHWIVPNFAKQILTEEELKEKTSLRLKKGVRIIFARRFYEFRGCVIFTEAMLRIMKEYDDVSVTFAGEGPYEEYIRDNFTEYGDRFSVIKYLPQESFAIHKNYDIAVVPTTGSEGTSLSLLEAMGAGCVVVSTPVGGLSNIVLDGFNGYISMPTSDDLYKTIKRAIENMDDTQIATNAINSVRCSFSKTKWASTWKGILKSIILE